MYDFKEKVNWLKKEIDTMAELISLNKEFIEKRNERTLTLIEKIELTEQKLKVINLENNLKTKQLLMKRFLDHVKAK